MNINDKFSIKVILKDIKPSRLNQRVIKNVSLT